MNRSKTAAAQARRRITATLAAFVAIIAVVAIYRLATLQTTPPPAALPAGAPATWHGNGDGNTPTFTTGGDWSLTYTYTCPAGETLRVIERGGPGDGVSLAFTTRDDDTATMYVHNSPGAHHLQILTRCAWAVAINDVVQPPAADARTST